MSLAPLVPAEALTTTKDDFAMAQTSSHSHVSSSTLSAPLQLPTLSERARTLAAVFRRFAADLELHDGSDTDGAARLGALVDAALNGAEHNSLNAEELEYLESIDALALLTGDV